MLEYYVCGAWKNKGATVCRSNGVRTDYADKYVLEKISNVACNDILVKSIVEKINKKNKGNATPLKNEYQSIKKSLDDIQSKKDKMLGLFEDGIIAKIDLSKRLASLSEEKERLEHRLAPIEHQVSQGISHEVNFKEVKQVMGNFMESYKKAMTREQRKQLMHLLISDITVSESRKIDTISIQMNKEVVKHFDTSGGEKSSATDDFSPPFNILIEL